MAIWIWFAGILLTIAAVGVVYLRAGRDDNSPKSSQATQGS